MEFLLLKQVQKDVWEVMVRPGKKAREGLVFEFGDGRLKAEVLSTTEGGNRLVRFHYDGEFYSLLEEIGNMPLPHYIQRSSRTRSVIRLYTPRIWVLRRLPQRVCTSPRSCWNALSRRVWALPM